MSERLKFILFIVFSLIVFWFTLILLCLPQGEPWPPAAPANVIVEDSPLLSQHHHARSSSSSAKTRRSEPPAVRRSQNSPQSADIMQIFNARPLSLLDTIFYQFDPVGNVTNLTTTSNISESKHKEATLKLGALNGPTDHYVKTRGDSLFSFNLVASNRVGLLRPLPDTRQAKCPRTIANSSHSHSYTCSIVICYYNEAPSALLRTIYSVLARTEHKLLKEIIIVDDFSEPGYDMDQIRAYLTSPRLRPPKSIGLDLVRFVRTPKREGLIRARLFGAAMAQGEVLVFLDSHVEPNVNWLEPLLDVIQANQTTIACPMIDLINAETMLYTASPMVMGGLTWALHFKWASVPASTLKTYDDFVKPIRSPTMAGGLFAIRREHFYRLGAYDPGMNLWGGENIELSLKAWMCAGRILILPCSRVGHIFRKTRPYGPAPDEPDSLTYNSHRVARVWLDEHVESYYREVPQARHLDSGDISERLELRQNLGCQNFTWFLDNVYPELREQPNANQSGENEPRADQKRARNLFVNTRRINRSVGGKQQGSLANMQPARDNTSNLNGDDPQVISEVFQIQLLGSNLCLEPKLSPMKRVKFSRLVLEVCEKLVLTEGNLSTKTSNQFWSETEAHEIRLAAHASVGGYCLDIMKNLPLLRLCHNMGSYQAWSHRSASSGNQTRIASSSSDGTHIMSYFSSGNLCLAAERLQRGEPVIVTICDKNDPDDHELRTAAAAVGSESQSSRRPRRRSRREGAGTWLSGPLPSATSNQRRYKSSALGSSSSGVHQKWKLNSITTRTNH